MGSAGDRRGRPGGGEPRIELRDACGIDVLSARPNRPGAPLDRPRRGEACLGLVRLLRRDAVVLKQPAIAVLNDQSHAADLGAFKLTAIQHFIDFASANAAALDEILDGRTDASVAHWVYPTLRNGTMLSGAAMPS